MTTKFKITTCYIALIASIIFLTIGVDYFPILACWIPFIVVAYFTLRYEPFRDNLADFLSNIIPE